MTRKPPIRHKVRPHTREGKRISGFKRGKGQSKKRTSKVVQGPVGIETIPGGECYSYAYRYSRKHPDATIVHATVIEPFAIDPNRHAHAWVEEGGIIYDWQTMVAGEGGKFTGKGWPKGVFYEVFEPKDVKKYTSSEILRNTFRNKHYGPWRDKR